MLREAQKADKAPAVHAASVFWQNKRLWPTLLVAVLVIWIFGWMYMGATWGIEERTHHIKAAVLNCDRGYPNDSLALIPLSKQPLSTVLLSSSIYNTTNSASTAFDWHPTACVQGTALQPLSSVSSTSAPGCSVETESACFTDLLYRIKRDDDYWFALYVPGNFSASFAGALNNASDTGLAYMQMNMAYIYTQGRSLSTSSTITSIFTAFMSTLSTTLGRTVEVAVARGTLTVSPDFYLAPIKLQSFNLAPVHTSGQNFASYILCVLMWLGCTFIVSAMWTFGAKTEDAVVATVLQRGTPNDHRKQVIFLALLKGAIAYLFTLLLMSLLIVIIVVEGAAAVSAASAQFEGHNAGYAIAFGWYMSFAFIAFQSILINIIGPVYFSMLSALLLILQLTSSAGIIASQLAQPFYRVGKALPFYYGVKGFRTIFFGAGLGRMWLNWVVLTAWNVGALPAALAIAIAKFYARVGSKLKSQRQSDAQQIDAEEGAARFGVDEKQQQQSGEGRKADKGLEDLGDVALMGT